MPPDARSVPVPGRFVPPPANPDELTFLAVDTRTPYTIDFEGADAGETAPGPSGLLGMGS